MDKDTKELLENIILMFNLSNNKNFILGEDEHYLFIKNNTKNSSIRVLKILKTKVCDVYVINDYKKEKFVKSNELHGDIIKILEGNCDTWNLMK